MTILLFTNSTLFELVITGYLRHVPLAYKHFTNPQRERPDFEMDNSKQNVGTEQPEVHI